MTRSIPVLLLVLGLARAHPLSVKDVDLPEVIGQFAGQDKFAPPTKVILTRGPAPGQAPVPLDSDMPDQLDDLLDRLGQLSQDEQVKEQLDMLKVFMAKLPKKSFYPLLKTVFEGLTGEAKAYADTQQRMHFGFLHRLHTHLQSLSDETVQTLLKLDEIFRNENISIRQDEAQMLSVLREAPDFVQNELKALGFKLHGF